MIRLENVLKTSLQDVLKMSWRRCCKTSSRCLEDVFARRLEDILKTFWRRLGKKSWRRLEGVWPRRIYWSWSRRLEDVLKRSSRRLLKTKTKDIFKTSWSRRIFAGNIYLNWKSFAPSTWNRSTLRTLFNLFIRKNLVNDLKHLECFWEVWLLSQMGCRPTAMWGSIGKF